jgi:transcriptional regulator with XRE-family HTH domain
VRIKSKNKTIQRMLVPPFFPPTLFARRMKTARQLRGISQMELGVRAGIDECSASARINQYERGKHTPDFLTVRNLAKALEIPAAYFFAEEDHLAELIIMFGQMEASEHNVLLDSAKALLIEAGSKENIPK